MAPNYKNPVPNLQSQPPNTQQMGQGQGNRQGQGGSFGSNVAKTFTRRAPGAQVRTNVNNWGSQADTAGRFAQPNTGWKAPEWKPQTTPGVGGRGGRSPVPPGSGTFKGGDQYGGMGSLNQNWQDMPSGGPAQGAHLNDFIDTPWSQDQTDQPGTYKAPGRRGGAGHDYWEGELARLQGNPSLVDPMDEWGDDSWMETFEEGDDLTADGGQRWQQERYSSGTRSKLKAGADPDVAAALQGVDPAQYAQVIKAAGGNPADYLEDEETFDYRPMDIPDEWMGEIQGWDPRFQQAYQQAYASGNEEQSQRIRNLARMEAQQRWQNQIPAAPYDVPVYAQPVEERQPPAPRPVTPVPQAPVLRPSVPWRDPNNPYY
jgi:hypothetical protein